MDILIAEDEPVSRRRLEAFLRNWGYDVHAVPDGGQALRALAAPDSPKLLLLDRMMPEVDGVDVCRAVRRNVAEPYHYVIMLTAHGHRREVIEGFEAGADDYITKPFEAEELRARIRTGARILELQEQLISAREQIRVEAMHDSLTGLFNRTAFFDAFARELAAAEREGTPLAVLMTDLDHFKGINDRHGHQAGDMVLRESARRIRATLRAFDIAGRYGGEEFVVVAPRCGLEDAHALAERLRTSICQAPMDAPAGPIRVTMSVGVAATIGAREPATLLSLADEALYRAKHGGRNKVELESVA